MAAIGCVSMVYAMTALIIRVRVYFSNLGKTMNEHESAIKYTRIWIDDNQKALKSMDIRFSTWMVEIESKNKESAEINTLKAEIEEAQRNLAKEKDEEEKKPGGVCFDEAKASTMRDLMVAREMIDLKMKCENCRYFYSGKDLCCYHLPMSKIETWPGRPGCRLWEQSFESYMRDNTQKFGD
jgi:predicted lactoylglutathione lyase